MATRKPKQKPLKGFRVYRDYIFADGAHPLEYKGLRMEQFFPRDFLLKDYKDFWRRNQEPVEGEVSDLDLETFFCEQCVPHGDHMLETWLAAAPATLTFYAEHTWEKGLYGAKKAINLPHPDSYENDCPMARMAYTRLFNELKHRAVDADVENIY